MRASQMIEANTTTRDIKRSQLPESLYLWVFTATRKLTRNGGRKKTQRFAKSQVSIAFAVIAVIIIGAWSPMTVLALDGKIFPGKGDKQTWLSACRLANDGIALTKAKKYDVAVTKFQQSIAMYPHADATYRNFGVLFEERAKPGDLQKAESAYRKACELDPKDWHNWSQLAGVLGKQERFKECRDAGVKALECNPPQERAAKMRTDIAGIDSYLAKGK